MSEHSWLPYEKEGITVQIRNYIKGMKGKNVRYQLDYILIIYYIEKGGRKNIVYYK